MQREPRSGDDRRDRGRGPAQRSASRRQLAFSFEVASAEPVAAASASIAVARPVLITPPPAASIPTLSVASPAAARVAAAIEPDDIARREIERAMASALGVTIEVELTRNRRTMISTQRVGTALRVRLHRMFVEADRAMIDALSRYVKTGDRRASRRLGEFIEAQRDRFVAPRARPVLRARGQHHDLGELFEEIERTFFPGVLEGVAITWGRHGGKRGRRRKRTIRLGTYTHDERLVRVHPVLDQPWVPRFFVAYIVFHELLHHAEPAREEEGRTIFHTREFRRRERAYPDYARAIAWETSNITRLLTS
jgi:hypothetical protein